MSEPRDLSPVIASSMCIGCGVCAVADPSVTVALSSRKQIFEPTSPGSRRAASVCPAIRVDFAGLQERLFPAAEQTPHGVVDAVFLAQSTDRQRNLNASSGGVLKEILRGFLELPEIDGVIALAHVAGLDFQPTLLKAPAEVDSLPGSIYHNLNQQRALELLRAHEGQYVLVALPCQLEGFFNYIFTLEPHLRHRLYATVGLLCGWQYSHHSIRAVCHYKGVTFDEIEKISYRGGGPIGRLTIDTPGGHRSIGRRLDYSYQVAFDRSFNTPRCHVCINHHNMLADIVVGDAWLASTLRTKTGISLVISRRPELTRRLETLAANDRIVLMNATTDDITESQSRRVVFGDFAYAYADYRRHIGEHTPDMVGSNRVEASLVHRTEAETFHRALNRKLELQWARRYRWLWWRKGTIEFRSYAARYLRWALKVTGLKSASGKRIDTSHRDMSVFR